MYLDYREKFELFIVSERDSEVRKPYLDLGEEKALMRDLH